jgi:hypothetical protein
MQGHQARVMPAARGERHGKWSMRFQRAATAIEAVWQAAEVDISSQGLRCRPRAFAPKLGRRLLQAGGARLAQSGMPRAQNFADDRTRGGSHWHWPCTRVTRQGPWKHALPPSAWPRSPQIT